MTVVVNMEADTRQAESSIASLARRLRTLENQAVNTGKAAGFKATPVINSTAASAQLAKLNNTAESAAKSLKTLQAAISTAFAIGSISLGFYQLSKSFDQTATQAINLSNKLRLVSKDTQDLAENQKELQAVARRSYGAFETSVDSFSKLSLALSKTGKTKKDILEFTETIQKAAASSGSSTETINASLYQLSQGFSSGILRGEELNSVIEGINPVSKIFEKYLSMTTGELRNFASEGKLTVDVMVKALTAGFYDIEELYSKVTPTTLNARQALKDSVMLKVGEIDTFFKMTEKSVARLYRLTDFINSIAVSSKTANSGKENNSQKSKVDTTPFEKLSTFLDSLNIKLKYTGIILNGTFNVIFSVFKRLSEAIPEIKFPVRTILQKLQVGVYSTVRGWLVWVRGEVRSGLLNVFGAPFSKLEEAINDVFRAATPEELIQAFKDVSYEISIFGKDWFNVTRFLKTGWISLRNTTKDWLISLGFIDQKLILIRARTSDGMNLVKKLGTRLKNATSKDVMNLPIINDLLTLIKAIKQYLGNLSAIFKRDFEKIKTSIIINLISGLMLIPNALKKVKDSVISFFLIILSSINSKTNGSLTSAKNYFISFFSSIKKGFLSLSTKLLGPSGWPGLIETIKSSMNKIADSKFFAFFKRFGEYFNNFRASIFVLKLAILGLYLSFQLLRFAIKESISQKSLVPLMQAIDIFKFFISIQSKLVGIAIKFDFAKPIEDMKNLSTTILNFVNNVLPKVKKVILSFVKIVENAFFWLYDKVIGNSWWPDLMNGILEYSNKVLPIVQNKISTFTQKVSSLFEKISQTQLTTSIKFSFDIKSIVGVLAETFNILYTNIRKVFPELAEFIVFTLSGAIATMINDGFSEGFKTVLKVKLLGFLSDFIIDFLTSFDNLKIVAGDIGKSLGASLGKSLATFIKNIPTLASVLIATADSFGEALLAQFGFIGSFVDKLANVFGVGGILNLLLFGVGLPALLGNFSLVTTVFNTMMTAFTKRSHGGVGVNDNGRTTGLIGSLLLGDGRLILTSIALITAALNVFTDPSWSSVTTLTGLVGIMLFGSTGTIVLIRAGLTSVLTYFGVTLAASSVLMTGIFANLGNIIAGFSLLSSATSMAQFRYLLGDMLVNFRQLFTRLTTLIGPWITSIVTYFGPVFTQISAMFSTFAARLRVMAIWLGGRLGAVGTFLFGTIGIAALVVAIVAIFSSSANAATSGVNSVLSGYSWTDIGLIGFLFLGPLAASALGALVSGLVKSLLKKIVASLAIATVLNASIGVLFSAILDVAIAGLASLGGAILAFIGGIPGLIAIGLAGIGYLIYKAITWYSTTKVERDAEIRLRNLRKKAEQIKTEIEDVFSKDNFNSILKESRISIDLEATLKGSILSGSSETILNDISSKTSKLQDAIDNANNTLKDEGKLSRAGILEVRSAVNALKQSLDQGGLENYLNNNLKGLQSSITYALKSSGQIPEDIMKMAIGTPDTTGARGQITKGTAANYSALYTLDTTGLSGDVVQLIDLLKTSELKLPSMTENPAATIEYINAAEAFIAAYSSKNTPTFWESIFGDSGKAQANIDQASQSLLMLRGNLLEGIQIFNQGEQIKNRRDKLLAKSQDFKLGFTEADFTKLPEEQLTKFEARIAEFEKKTKIKEILDKLVTSGMDRTVKPIDPNVAIDYEQLKTDLSSIQQEVSDKAVELSKTLLERINARLKDNNFDFELKFIDPKQTDQLLSDLDVLDARTKAFRDSNSQAALFAVNLQGQKLFSLYADSETKIGSILSLFENVKPLDQIMRMDSKTIQRADELASIISDTMFMLTTPNLDLGILTELRKKLGTASREFNKSFSTDTINKPVETTLSRLNDKLTASGAGFTLDFLPDSKAVYNILAEYEKAVIKYNNSGTKLDLTNKNMLKLNLTLEIASIEDKFKALTDAGVALPDLNKFLTLTPKTQESILEAGKNIVYAQSKLEMGLPGKIQQSWSKYIVDSTALISKLSGETSKSYNALDALNGRLSNVGLDFKLKVVPETTGFYIGLAKLQIAVNKANKSGLTIDMVNADKQREEFFRLWASVEDRLNRIKQQITDVLDITKTGKTIDEILLLDPAAVTRLAELGKVMANIVQIINAAAVTGLDESMRMALNEKLAGMIREFQSIAGVKGEDKGSSDKGKGDAKTWWEGFKEALSSMDLSIDEKVLAGMSASAIDNLISASTKYKAAQDAINKSTKDQVELRRQSLRIMQQERQLAIGSLDNGTFGAAKARGSLTGSSFDEATLAYMNKAQIESKNAIEERINALTQERNTMAAGSAEQIKSTWELKQLGWSLEGLSASAMMLPDAVDAAKDSFESGISAFLKGEASFKSVITGMLDTFTSSVIDSFSKMITNKIFSSIGSSVLGSFFGFAATGGKISGSGSGTSDSIPMMLSNGEYVVNAATTKQWLPFLEAINSGDRLPAFANGGRVGPVNPKVLAISKSGNKGSNQQVYNINVTGDISRQTRSEIVKMIPEITSGVNVTNRERGSK